MANIRPLEDPILLSVEGFYCLLEVKRVEYLQINMSIYTRTGDKGKTSLFSGKRVLKSDFQVEAYGSVDELSSFIGLVGTKVSKKEEKLLLVQIQKDLYQIMAFLSGSKKKIINLEKRVKIIERYIKNREVQLSKLNRFILIQQPEISSWFNVLRTVCRRGERAVVRFFDQTGLDNQKKGITQPIDIITYLNRLSDLFFIMARDHLGQEETLV